MCIRDSDWVQSLDRPKLVATLARHRPADLPPLNVLLQVNIDDETSKHGCMPTDIDALADAVAAEPRLQLRGLMAIPAPHEDPARRRDAFRAMRTLFDALQARHPGIDTLSMGMSEDFVPAIEEGATMAVSYTHLDVYKRQVRQRGSCADRGRARPARRSGCAPCCRRR